MRLKICIICRLYATIKRECRKGASRLFAHERHQLIIQKLKQEHSVRAAELMESFGVSFETIRRDLELLESKGYLTRIHGGARLVTPDYSSEIPLPVREAIYLEEKSELAAIACRYISEGMSLSMDSSTTNTLLARMLRTRFEKLTVVTNSLPIVNELIGVPGFTLILIGGMIRHEEQSIVGDLAEEFVSRFHTDLFLMSLSGVSLAEGVTDYGIGEVQVKRIMKAHARETIALGDSSKFDHVSLIKVCPASEVSRFVTDSKIDRELVARYRQQGLDLVFE